MGQPNHHRVRASRAVLLALIVAAFVATVVRLNSPAADTLNGPTAEQRQVTLMISSLLRRDHLSKQPLDDLVSRRALDKFLESLDPRKIYFLQSDVDEFMLRRNELDDMLKKGDISFAYTIFERFLQRVDERVELVDQLLEQEHDFTIDEEMVTDRDLLRYPRDEDEARDRWRKRIKYDLLIQKSDKKTHEEAIDKLHRRYMYFAKRMHQFDDDELMEMYVTAITSSYDPHTTFMSKSTLENFDIQFKLQLQGIGAALSSVDGETIVTKIIKGGAADKHGKLKPEDRIVSVGEGEDGEMVDIVDMKLNDVVARIRGKAGTKVRLGVIHQGENKLNTYTITRAVIELKENEARAVIFEKGQKASGAPYKIGVIELPSFYMDMKAARLGLANYKSTTRDVRRLLDELKEKRVDAVVLDLRNNGGGSLTEAIDCTGLFIDRGPVVQVKDQGGRVSVYDDRDAGVAWDGPLVVVISKFSASASEILAGAIQDYDRGIIVGDASTHGKGTVQSLLELGRQLFRVADPPNYGALKITMQQFYRPDGDSTQKRGVLADVVLPSITQHMDVGEADLEFAMDFDRVPASRFTDLDMVDDNIRDDLRTRSATRIGQKTEFTELMDDIKKYREQKAKKTVTLNEEKFLAERAELDADKEDEKQIEEQQETSDDEVVKRDFYFEEVLDIAVDYVRVLNGHHVAVGR